MSTPDIDLGFLSLGLDPHLIEVLGQTLVVRTQRFKNIPNRFERGAFKNLLGTLPLVDEHRDNDGANCFSR